MNTAENLGPEWQLQYLLEQEERAEKSLRLIYRELVIPGKLDKESFNEIVYLTGVRYKP